MENMGFKKIPTPKPFYQRIHTTFKKYIRCANYDLMHSECLEIVMSQLLLILPGILHIGILRTVYFIETALIAISHLGNRAFKYEVK